MLTSVAQRDLPFTIQRGLALEKKETSTITSLLIKRNRKSLSSTELSRDRRLNNRALCRLTLPNKTKLPLAASFALSV